MTIKVIETSYRGYRFRSRLEARWAVFFDALGLEWEYEPEGFDLDGIWYLPDFKVSTPQWEDCWYEIKPSKKSDDGKIARFLEMIDYKHSGGIINGDPFDFFEVKDTPKIGSKSKACPRCGSFCVDLVNDVVGDLYFSCIHCDSETPCGSGHPEEYGFFDCPYIPYKGSIIPRPDFYGLLVKRKIEDAAKKARSARFEHGQSGATL